MGHRGDRFEPQWTRTEVGCSASRAGEKRIGKGIDIVKARHRRVSIVFTVLSMGTSAVWGQRTVALARDGEARAVIVAPPETMAWEGDDRAISVDRFGRPRGGMTIQFFGVLPADGNRFRRNRRRESRCEPVCHSVRADEPERTGRRRPDGTGADLSREIIMSTGGFVS